MRLDRYHTPINHTEVRAMNHSDLVEKVAETTEMPKATASRAVEAVVQTITEALEAGDEVRVTGFKLCQIASWKRTRARWNTMPTSCHALGFTKQQSEAQPRWYPVADHRRLTRLIS
jgi:Bacterial DNA-binding protein